MSDVIRPPFEQSDALGTLKGIRHGFFGRRGGGHWDLDTSETLGTDRDRVAANRRLALTAIGIGALPLAGLAQKHTSTALILDAVPGPDDRPVADAMVTALPNLALAIVTADCAPILFADPDAGVIGACHAGWQGAVDGIVGHTLDAMTALGASPRTITAAIGPTIGFQNYEVGDAFARNLSIRNPMAARFLAVPPGRMTVHFDLPGFLLAELERAGIGAPVPSRSCTYAAPDLYFSHRFVTHHGGPEGRQIALIARTAR